MFSTKHSTRRNLAARMGRWSAAHWKTATFGWLALVVVAFAVGGLIGTKNVDPNTAGPGESGRMDRILDAGFKLPADESVLIQSRSVRVGAPAFDAAVADVVARVSKLAAVQNVRSPLDPANAGQIAKSGHAALVEFEIRGDKDKAGDKLGPVLDGVDDAQRAHPGFFIGEFGDASSVKAVDTAFADDLKSAGVFSIPLTLIILVVAFGALVAAGIPLLLGAHGRFRDVRTGRAAQSPAPDRTRSLRGRAAGRARGRRRLLDVLPAARARGACRGAERARGARSRRRHLGPLGPDLRPDGDGGDGRDVPDGRCHLRLLRPRDDDRRRCRDARLADRPPGAALEARRQGRPAARPARRPAPPRRAAKVASGERSSTASCAGRCCRRCSPAACCWRSPPRRFSCAWRLPGPTRSRSRSRW